MIAIMGYSTYVRVAPEFGWQATRAQAAARGAVAAPGSHPGRRVPPPAGIEPEMPPMEWFVIEECEDGGGMPTQVTERVVLCI